MHPIDQGTPPAVPTYELALDLFRSLGLDMRDWNERALFNKMVQLVQLNPAILHLSDLEILNQAHRALR